VELVHDQSALVLAGKERPAAVDHLGSPGYGFPSMAVGSPRVSRLFFRHTLTSRFDREGLVPQCTSESDSRCDQHDSWITTSERESSIALGPAAVARSSPIAPTTVLSAAKVDSFRVFGLTMANWSNGRQPYIAPESSSESMMSLQISKISPHIMVQLSNRRVMIMSKGEN
jgi:hypothetical protein